MRRHPLLISLAVLGAILVAGCIWLALELGPLGALSLPPPLSDAIHTEASPCIFMVSTDAHSANRAAINRALQSYAAENGFKSEAEGLPSEGAYASMTYDGPGTLSLLASSDSRHFTIQIFRDERDHANYTQQISHAATAFKAAELNEPACR